MGLEPTVLYSGLKVRAVRHYGNQSVYFVVRLHLWTICYTTSKKLAGRLGIEPRFAESKAAVLPLDDLPIISFRVYVMLDIKLDPATAFN